VTGRGDGAAASKTIKLLSIRERHFRRGSGNDLRSQRRAFDDRDQINRYRDDSIAAQAPRVPPACAIPGQLAQASSPLRLPAQQSRGLSATVAAMDPSAKRRLTSLLRPPILAASHPEDFEIGRRHPLGSSLF
jgi:hypothetical protein